MPIDTSLLLGAAFKAGGDLARSRIEKRLNREPELIGKISECFDEYVAEVLRWSSRVQWYGLAEAESTDAVTVSLALAEPRRLRGTRSVARRVRGELDLLAYADNFLLLGDPGGGKTTTLKRLVRNVLTSEPTSDTDVYRYPVVVRLRDHIRNGDLYLGIADVLRLPYDLPNLNDPERNEAKLGAARLRDRLPELLNDHNAILLLDGLDEVPNLERPKLEAQISQLADRLQESKIILTSRSGEYSRHLEGFTAVELEPLSADEVEGIAARWLEDPKDFLDALSKLPYRDVINRPLLLAQLLLLYRGSGMLPEQPALVYRRLVMLLLEEWDKGNNVVRKSKYGSFDVERKRDFLAALAYHLTYRLQRVSFGESDLHAAYSMVRTRFDLPQHQAHDVIAELESHNGIVVISASGYEFSHLSFQEYLCADYLVREPYSERLTDYIRAYPAPIAVAVTLASSPGLWLAGVILKEANYSAFSSDSLRSFLTRLWIERPSFEVNPALGIVMLRLWYDQRRDPMISDVLTKLFGLEPVITSLASALQYYRAVSAGFAQSSDVEFRSTMAYHNRYGFETPLHGALPYELLKKIMIRNGGALHIAIDDPQRQLRLDEEGKVVLTPLR